MSLLNRAVFDTSTLISAVLRPSSVPRQAFMSALGSHTLYVSPETLGELKGVLLRPKFDTYASPTERAEFFARYKQETTLLAPDAQSEQTAEGACRDPKDCKFLALAMACNAGVLVSSDEDLLSLKTWQGTQIVSPAAFLSRSVH
ncbi:MAG: putative toxin-antitoxin system toxin component, PIN family [Polaromonas sp.]